MRTINLIRYAALLTLCAHFPARGDQINLGAVSGDYVTSNPGFESVIPYWKLFDSNGDGSPDGYKFHFDVYKIGTSTKLFATPEVFFAITCPTGQKLTDQDKSVDFKRIDFNIVMSVKQLGYCSGGKELNLGYLYAVNLSVAGKKPWSKNFTNPIEGSGILPDMNGNGVGELQAATSAKDASGNTNANVYIYDGETGTSLITPKTYPVVR